MLTFGLGQGVGTWLSGKFVDFYASKDAAGKVVHDWQPFWLWAAAMSAVVAIAFVALFRDKIVLQPETADAQVREESLVG